MTATITAATGGTTSPQLVLGYQTARTSRNRVRDLLGGGIAVSLVSPRPRSGELRMLYAAEADASAALALHAQETLYTLTDTDRPGIGMRYALSEGGELRLELEDETRGVWVLTVPYQEVPA